MKKSSLIQRISLASIVSTMMISQSLSAEVLGTGLHLVGSGKNMELKVGDFSDGVKAIYGISNRRTGYVSFLPTNKYSFLNGLQKLKVNEGYLVQVDGKTANFPTSIPSHVKECSIQLYKGLNIVALYGKDPLPIGMNKINGAQIKAIYAISSKRTGYVSYLPTNKYSFLNGLKKLKDGSYYLVVANSNSTGICSNNSSSSSSSSSSGSSSSASYYQVTDTDISGIQVSIDIDNSNEMDDLYFCPNHNYKIDGTDDNGTQFTDYGTWSIVDGKIVINDDDGNSTITLNDQPMTQTKGSFVAQDKNGTFIIDSVFNDINNTVCAKNSSSSSSSAGSSEGSSSSNSSSSSSSSGSSSSASSSEGSSSSYKLEMPPTPPDLNSSGSSGGVDMPPSPPTIGTGSPTD